MISVRVAADEAGEVEETAEEWVRRKWSSGRAGEEASGAPQPSAPNHGGAEDTKGAAQAAARPRGVRAGLLRRRVAKAGAVAARRVVLFRGGEGEEPLRDSDIVPRDSLGGKDFFALFRPDPCLRWDKMGSEEAQSSRVFRQFRCLLNRAFSEAP